MMSTHRVRQTLTNLSLSQQVSHSVTVHKAFHSSQRNNTRASGSLSIHTFSETKIKPFDLSGSSWPFLPPYPRSIICHPSTRSIICPPPSNPRRWLLRPTNTWHSRWASQRRYRAAWLNIGANNNRRQEDLRAECCSMRGKLAAVAARKFVSLPTRKKCHLHNQTYLHYHQRRMIPALHWKQHASKWKKNISGWMNKLMSADKGLATEDSLAGAGRKMECSDCGNC